ncbi:hypothetical protein SAMN04487894_101602 [Niabella drilacis]|uniref:Uncharacterized protein n=1 Tax=Niabella drilacis (strain DSM 25811 / CCM 8410 / CCUG 62505 / LMG 26954 / E90) TaxID=1285928 RepID=A0A1G6JPX3_NIADE|nr:hypothetical protein SAMN04487894_101602 [Niabella drilacis]
MLLLLLATHGAVAQKTIVHTWIHYQGTIGSYPVEIKIRHTQNTDSIQGEYYYTRKGSSSTIYLEGTTAPNGAHISESAYNRQLQKHEKTGTFTLNAIGSKDLSGTWTGTHQNTLPVQLKRVENESVNDLQQWEIRLRLYKGKEENAGGSLQDYTKANKLFIHDPVKKITKELDGFDEVLYNDYGEAELEDLDFDGYPDLKIPIYFPQATKNDGSFLYFIYNPKTRQFASNKALNELGFLDFNALTKEFRKSDADGRGNEGDAYYKWVGGKFYLIREVRVYEDRPQVFYTEYTIRNGQSVKTRTYKK